ncbi:Glutamine amidotransferase class-I [Acetanaerobacterium elongatum]|uniref:Glutamine amidotransferase class-I n=2 Tax=Acetanaerobacterium elongatum TaxID=258515 RepID=A0A1H0E108_9FIRM|nr:Glutamine amidotransferase class-I [Acetanaerobacterium elongatum]
MNGAVAGIQFAREHDYPFIGTCGGFQHAVVEYARNVLKIEELKHADFDIYAPNSVITPLTCSLMGLTGDVHILSGTQVSAIYSDVIAEEKYTCNFGVSADIKERLDRSGLKVVGTDDNGETRIVELGGKTFYIATLLQPQLSSTPEHPHPLILAYLRAALAFHNGRQN